MTTATTVIIRCKWCNAILFEVEGGTRGRLRTRCPERTCRMWLDIVLD